MKKQKVWTNPECLSCLIAITHDLLQKATDDPKVQIEGMQKTYQILKGFAMTSPPTDVANKIYLMIQNITQKTDLFKDIKVKSNELARVVMNRIRPSIRAIKDLNVRLERGLAAAIAGNVIDFGTSGHSVELTREFLEQIYRDIVKEGFAIDNSGELLEALHKSNEIVYIADNAGEVYFDLLLLEEIKDYVNVILVVKGAPVSNDATLEDINHPLFKEFAKKIITTGSGSLGVSVEQSSDEFRKSLQTADFIIAKGQSNFETLYFYHQQLTTKPIFFIFRTKCPSIANFMEQEIGNNIVMLKNPH